jgi:hypothetical protein
MRLLTTNWKSDLHRLAIGGAWFFAFASLIPLLWLGLGGDAGGTNRVFGTEAGGQVHTVWGLTYSGFFGTLLLWAEALVVAAAATLTGLPRRFVTDRTRRIGHGALIAWASVWTLGVSNLATVQPGFFAVQAVFLALLLGCTGYRAWCEWGTSDDDASADDVAPDPGWLKYDEQPMQADRSSPPTDIASEEKLMIHLRDVKSSAALRELPTLPGAGAPKTLTQRAAQVVNRQSLRDAARSIGRFTADLARSTAEVSSAIGKRFVAAAKAWKSYDAEESSTRV